MTDRLIYSQTWFLGITQNLTFLFKIYLFIFNLTFLKWTYLGGKTLKNLQNLMDNEVINIQFILIIFMFCICKFAYSLKCNCSPQIITCGDFMDTWRYKEWQKIWVTKCAVWAEVKRGNTHCPFLFSALTLETSVLFMVYLVPCFAHFCAFHQWFWGLIWPLSVARAEMHLVEKIRAWDKLHSGMGHSAVSLEVNADGSTTHTNEMPWNRNTYETRY